MCAVKHQVSYTYISKEKCSQKIHPDNCCISLQTINVATWPRALRLEKSLIDREDGFGEKEVFDPKLKDGNDQDMIVSKRNKHSQT